VSVGALLAGLSRRGIRVIPEGESIRCVGPRGVLTPEDLEELKRHKPEILAELQPAGPDPTLGAIAETREQIGAVRIHSRRFGEVWVALSESTAAELQAEEAGRPETRPVLTPADVAHLLGKPAAAIRAVLEVARVFPGARVVQ
jgi:hypothetical protein